MVQPFFLDFLKYSIRKATNRTNKGVGVFSPPKRTLLAISSYLVSTFTCLEPLTSVQFLLLNLSMDLSRLASAMLSVLRSLTNGSILVYDHFDINFDTLPNKKVLLFTKSQFIGSMTRQPKQVTKLFILEEDKTKVDHRERFANTEDLIFQLADELCRYYKSEAIDDVGSNNPSLAKEKEMIANRIHSELQAVYQNLSKNENNEKPLLSTTTSIVYLKSKDHEESDMNKAEDLFKDIVTSFATFEDERKCYDHLCANDSANAIFLIIASHCQDSSVANFQRLSNIKQVYRFDQTSSSTKDLHSPDGDPFWFQLTHDLLSYYNRLGNEFSSRKEAQKAKEMFVKAHRLCQVIFEH